MNVYECDYVYVCSYIRTYVRTYVCTYVRILETLTPSHSGVKAKHHQSCPKVVQKLILDFSMKFVQKSTPKLPFFFFKKADQPESTSSWGDFDSNLAIVFFVMFLFLKHEY